MGPTLWAAAGLALRNCLHACVASARKSEAGRFRPFAVPGASGNFRPPSLSDLVVKHDIASCAIAQGMRLCRFAGFMRVSATTGESSPWPRNLKSSGQMQRGTRSRGAPRSVQAATIVMPNVLPNVFAACRDTLMSKGLTCACGRTDWRSRLFGRGRA